MVKITEHDTLAFMQKSLQVLNLKKNSLNWNASTRVSILGNLANIS